MRICVGWWKMVIALTVLSAFCGCQQDPNLPNYTAPNNRSSGSFDGRNSALPKEDRSFEEGFAHGGGSTIPLLQIAVMDVGQGDCTLIGTPGGKVYLIDGGPAGSEKVVSDMLQKSGVDHLDGVFITNWNQEHVGGLPQILETISVSKVYGPDLSSGVETEKAVRDVLTRRGKQLETMHGGGQIPLDDKVMAEILAPVEPIERGNLNPAAWINNNSIVLRVSFGQSRVLFASSMAALERDKLMASSDSLQTSVLIVPDHGSREGMDADFLAKVVPGMAFISCGKGNSEGAPHAEVLEALKHQSVSLARTDLEGTVFIRCEEGGHVTAQPSHACDDEALYKAGKPSAGKQSVR